MRNRILKIIMILLIIIIHSLAIVNYIVYAALPPSSSEIFNGMDVSAFQREIDYSKVKNSGIDFVYIKSSEGTSLIDPYFERNYTMAKENNLKVGFYHFVRARNEEEAINEAIFFARVIEGKNPDGKLAMDFEVFGDLSRDEINKISFAFLIKLEEITNKECVIYSDASNARDVFSRELAQKYPLWIAEYGVDAPTDNVNWSEWVGFQYTDVGRVDGINGNVDLDRYTENILLNNEPEEPEEPETPIPEPKPEPENPDKEAIYYVVKKGDTLSEIALWYNTTVEELVKLNNIENPDLIYIGQKILISDDPKKENEVVYTVVRGDTLWKISNRYGVKLNKIVELNNIKNPNLIYPGQKIRIPLSEDSNKVSIIYYKVKRGDTLWAISRRYRTTINRIARTNGIRNPNRIYVGQILKIY